MRPFAKKLSVLFSIFSLSVMTGMITGCSSGTDTSSDTGDGTVQTSESASSSVSSCEDDADSSACDAYEVAAETSNNFTKISFDEAIEFFEDGKTGILYFGFPLCPWCQEVVPILEEESKDEDIEVYYIQTRDDEKNRLYTDEQKEEIIPYIGEYMSENEDGELTLYVPLVVSVIDGKAVMAHQGTVDGHDAKEREMTDEEKAEVEADLLAVFESQKTNK